MPTEPDERNELVPEDDRIIGTAFRWSLLAIAFVALLTLIAAWLLRERPAAEPVVARGPVTAPPVHAPRPEAIPSVEFSDVGRQAGIDFSHTNGAYGLKLLPETMGGGVALFDYDGDRDQDLLFVNSNHWPEKRSEPGPTMRLYRNDGLGNFDDVTRRSGLDVSFYGQGAAVGDYDSDGDVDLFFSALGPNRLFRNDGGRFREVTAIAGVAGAETAWSTSAGFVDFDNDGDLDLFVCNYVSWSRELDLQLHFTLNGTDRAYGPPKQYPGAHSYLYRNEGDGTFRDVSAETGIQVSNPATGEPVGKALAVTFFDVDRDGFLDIFVANDTVQNFAFRNRNGRRFEELGATSGVGFDNTGSATGAMGLDAAEITGEGAIGIGIGNFANEQTSMYLQQEDPWQFVDLSSASGIGSPSRLRLSFGLFFFDYDLDGRLDLLQANGHLEDEINQIQPTQHYRQPAQLFWNCSAAERPCFRAVPEERLGALGRPIVGRGAAFGDLDGDGDLDVVLAQNGGPPLVVRNDQQSGHHWLRVKLVGTAANRDAIGAEVELRSGETVQRRCVMPSRSYLSQVELPLTFGLGEETTIDSLVVRWPGGAVQRVSGVAVDAPLEIVQPG